MQHSNPVSTVAPDPRVEGYVQQQKYILHSLMANIRAEQIHLDSKHKLDMFASPDDSKPLSNSLCK